MDSTKIKVLFLITSSLQLVACIHYFYKRYKSSKDKSSLYNNYKDPSKWTEILSSSQRDGDGDDHFIKLPNSNYNSLSSKIKTDKQSMITLNEGTKKKISEEEDILIREQLTRNYSFLGEENMNRLRNSFIVVIGCGGVGSHAAHMLARSGIGYLRLVDFDNVTLSSLNRAPLATRKDVGLPKVVSLALHLKAISPWVEVDPLIEVFTPDKADRILSPLSIDGRNFKKPDFVLDCIDQIDSKVSLLEICFRRKLPVLSSMGAGCKIDPTKIAISDIRHTKEDSLARAVRKRLKDKGIRSGIKVVYSCERPSHVSLLPFNEEYLEKGDDENKHNSSLSTQIKDFAVLPDFRVRILPVLGPLPALFGITMSTFIIQYLTRQISDIDNHADQSGIFDKIGTTFSSQKSSKAANNRYLRDLVARERKLAASLKPSLSQEEKQAINSQKGPFPISLDDITYLMESVWHHESLFDHFSNNSNDEKNGRSPKLVLVRWRKEKSLNINNLILLTEKEARYHDKYPSIEAAIESFENSEGQQGYSSAFVQYVDNKLSSIQPRVDSPNSSASN